MTWEDEYRNHQVWETVDEAIEAFKNVEAEDLDDRLLRVLAMLSELRGVADAPHPAVTDARLDLVNGAVTAIGDALGDDIEAIFTKPKTPPNVAAPFNRLVLYLREWPVTGKAKLNGLARHAEAVDELFLELSQRLSTRLETLDAALEATKDRQQTFAEDLQNSLQDQSAKVEEQSTVLSDELKLIIRSAREEHNEQMEELQEESAAAAETIEQQKVRLDSVLSDHQERFAAAQEERTSQWRTQLEENSEQLEDHLKRMEGYEARSQKVLSAVGVNATATDYGAYANAQATTANHWRIGAVVALSIAGGVFAFTAVLSYFGIGTDLDWWQVVAQKLGAPVGLAAVGYFLARESSQHRRQERDARQAQLTLTALEPFIANLPEEEQRQIRFDTARSIFIQPRRGDLAKKELATKKSADAPDPT